MIELKINGRAVTVDDGTSVAAAIIRSGAVIFRRSASGELHGPLCGMGICFECRVTINGVPHRRSCTIAASDGMEVMTGE